MGLCPPPFRDVVTKRIIKLSWRLGFPSPFLPRVRHVEVSRRRDFTREKGFLGLEDALGTSQRAYIGGYGMSGSSVVAFWMGVKGLGFMKQKFLEGRFVYKNKILNINGLVVLRNFRLPVFRTLICLPGLNIGHSVSIHLKLYTAVQSKNILSPSPLPLFRK